MTKPIQGIELSALTIAERIQIAHALLDSVVAETQGEFVSAEQLREIDRRIAASDAGQVVGEPMETVFAPLLE